MIIRVIEEIGKKEHGCICGYEVNGTIMPKEGNVTEQKYTNERDIENDYNSIKSTWTMLAMSQNATINEDLGSVVVAEGNRRLTYDVELPNGLTYRRTCDYVNQNL